jgi:uncharacterized protein (TIGR03083 family)
MVQSARSAPKEVQVADRTREIVDELRAARAEVLDLVGPLSPAQFDRLTSNEGWSVKDTLAHLSSIEARLRTTMQHAVEGRAWPDDAPNIDTYNARSVDERRSWTAEAIVAELRQTGPETEAAIDRLNPADLDREWDHPVRGRVTVEALARIAARHLRSHATEIAAALRD